MIQTIEAMIDTQGKVQLLSMMAVLWVFIGLLGSKQVDKQVSQPG